MYAIRSYYEISRRVFGTQPGKARNGQYSVYTGWHLANGYSHIGNSRSNFTLVEIEAPVLYLKQSLQKLLLLLGSKTFVFLSLVEGAFLLFPAHTGQ